MIKIFQKLLPLIIYLYLGYSLIDYPETLTQNMQQFHDSQIAVKALKAQSKQGQSFFIKHIGIILYSVSLLAIFKVKFMNFLLSLITLGYILFFENPYMTQEEKNSFSILNKAFMTMGVIGVTLMLESNNIIQKMKIMDQNQKIDIKFKM